MMDDLNLTGYAWTRNLFNHVEIEEIKDALTNHSNSADVRTHRGNTFGIRNLLQVPKINSVANSSGLSVIVQKITAPNVKAIKAVFFDKVPGANWNVSWHQDLTIAVKNQREVSGFGPWSVKAGIVHVQPHISVLEQILTVRIHLDECPEDNGPLKIIPGTHRHGCLSQSLIQETASQEKMVTCTAKAGDALFMKPLLLHSSSAATTPSHRRILHLEYSAANLPDGLEWHL